MSTIHPCLPMKPSLLLACVFVMLSASSIAQDLRIHFKGDSLKTYSVSQIDSLTVLPCAPDSLIVTAVSPSLDCVETFPRPTFTWSTQFPAVRPGKLSYTLTVVEGKIDEDPAVSIAKNKPVFVQANLTAQRLQLPATVPSLKEGVPYLWHVEAYDGVTRIAVSNLEAFHVLLARFPFDLREIFCCKNGLLTNGSFEMGLRPGPLNGNGGVASWTAAYGAPVASAKDGCDDPGFISLSGNRTSGSAIAQVLAPSNKIIQGKRYRVSFCVLYSDVARGSRYARVRAVAYNGTLPSYGVHPVPSSTVSTIGQSGKMSYGNWITTSLPVWRANRNYDAVAFYVCSDSPDTTAYCSIDNVCIMETTDSVSCDDVLYSDVGDPIIPSELASYREPTITEVREYREEERGSVSDLYGDMGNTALDTWYPNNDPCASVGGTVPPEALNYNITDSLAGLGLPGGVAQLDSILGAVVPDTSSSPTFPPIAGDTSQCRKDFVADNSQPFGGRDIIYVHGLQLNHLCDIKSNVRGSEKKWPADKAEFYAGGYFKTVAEDNWRDHIAAFLPGHTNRYLIVSYNCSQRLDVAVNAILTQIRDAMADGTGVVNPNGKDSSKLCFGRNAVIISHSTGGPVVDVAMSIANKTKSDAALRASYGNVGFISDRIRAHVSLTGAQSGSRLASTVVALQASPTIATLATAALALLDCIDLTQANFYSLISSSILIDLVPVVMRVKWSSSINSTPVPVLAITGGHPTAILGPVKYALHPGLDDGVLTTSCTSSNPNIETILTPSGYFRDGAFYRVFDMGIGGTRGVGYYLDQTLTTLPGWIGGGMVTHLSATGMVQPVAGTLALFDPHNRFSNHYSFIQSASDHIQGAHRYIPSNYNYATSPGFDNFEESRAITDPFVYSSGLVSTAMTTMQHETVKGRYLTIGFHLPWLRRKSGFPFWEFYLRYFSWTITIWERRYHNLAGYQTKGYAHYVYDYVLRP